MKKYALFRLIIVGVSLFALGHVVPMAVASNLEPLLDLTGGGMAVEPLADAVGGWSFHIDRPLTIGAVGLWDEGKLPLSIAHEVGLWTSTQTLLLDTFVNNSSVAVASASPDGQWLFTPVTPFTLQPGDYVMAAVWGDPNNGADPFRIMTHAVTNGLTYTAQCAKFQLSGLQLVFPDCGGGSLNNASYFGPNLAVVTPEPSTWILMVIGVGETIRRRWNR
jgi:hypothetical protein